MKNCAIEIFNFITHDLIFQHFFSIFRASIEHHNSKNSSSSIPSDSAKESIANDKKKPHIKKPLNAFMLYMKEMRAQVNVKTKMSWKSLLTILITSSAYQFP